MGSTHKAIIVRRVAKTLSLLCKKPLTAKELGEKLGITNFCAYLYFEMLRDAGYPVMSKVRHIPGPGMNPTEYWLDYTSIIAIEAMRLIAYLRK